MSCGLTNPSQRTGPQLWPCASIPDPLFYPHLFFGGMSPSMYSCLSEYVCNRVCARGQMLCLDLCWDFHTATRFGSHLGGIEPLHLLAWKDCKKNSTWDFSPPSGPCGTTWSVASLRAKMAVLWVFASLPSASCTPPFPARYGLWMGEADLERGAEGTKAVMVVELACP